MLSYFIKYLDLCHWDHEVPYIKITQMILLHFWNWSHTKAIRELFKSFVFANLYNDPNL